MSAGNKPDYNVGAMNRTTGQRNNHIGAAWINDDKTIDIKLDPYVTLTSDSDLMIKLFPTGGKPPQAPNKPFPRSYENPSDDDNTPF